MQIWEPWASHEWFHLSWKPRKPICTETNETDVQGRKGNTSYVPIAAAFLALGLMGHLWSLAVNSFGELKLTHMLLATVLPGRA